MPPKQTTVSKTIKEKSQSKEEKPVKPKRPQSAYMRWANGASGRAKIKKEFPNITFQEMGKELGNRWRSMDDKEKAPYVKAAADEKQKMKK